MYLLRRQHRPTHNEMRKSLHTLVTVVCLLVLLLPAAAFCMQHHHVAQPLCSHCPQHSDVPPCCTAQQHQSPSIPTGSLESPTLSLERFTPSYLDESKFYSSPSSSAL